MKRLMQSSITLFYFTGIAVYGQQIRTATVLLRGHRQPTEISYEVRNGTAVFEGDIELGKEADLLNPPRGPTYSSRPSWSRSGPNRAVRERRRFGSMARLRGAVQDRSDGESWKHGQPGDQCMAVEHECALPHCHKLGP
jgi:hypothetical protein